MTYATIETLYQIKYLQPFAMNILEENGHLPLILKLCSKILMFWNYLAKCPCFWNLILTNWVLCKTQYSQNRVLCIFLSITQH